MIKNDVKEMTDDRIKKMIKFYQSVPETPETEEIMEVLRNEQREREQL